MSNKEILQITLKDLGIKKRTRKRLSLYNIETLEDLLQIDYENLTKIRQLGIGGLKEIKGALHNAGYKIKNEDKSQEVQKEKIKQEGKVLLEELGFSPQAYSLLYREGIFTLQQLNNRWREIPIIKGYGPNRQRQLLDQLTILGVGITGEGLLIPKEVEQQAIEQEKLNKSAKEEQKQSEDIKRRNILIEMQQSLLKEKQALIIREQEIDNELAKIRCELLGARKNK